ncbi:MAG: glycosyltransferase family 4 protein [Anaerolineales bacterium]|nr:MAG: glycosyltransferase family 4 protein [Anaerolineales bacterium]
MLSKACVVGAYQKKLEEIAQHDGMELTVVVPPEWQDERGTLRLERAHTTGYELRVEPIAFNGHFHTHYYPSLGRIVRQLQPEVVHIDEEPYNLATFQAMRAARRAGARTVVFTWQNLQRRYPPPFRWMESYVLARTDVLLTGNAEGVDVWRAKGYKGAVEVIPQFGVDPDIYSRITRPSRPSKPSVLLRRSTRRPSQSELVIGYIGRLVPEKGIDVLLEAVAQLRGPWELRILGSGPERDRLEKMSQWLGILPRVSFDLPIPSTQLPYYYSGLDVLVLPSRTRSNWKEQFGRVLIEAMACQVVVVGARCGAIPEVIDDAGLTFAEGDSADLRAQLQRLLREAHLRLELAQKGRQRVLDHFTQSRIAERTVEIYKGLGHNSA